MTDTFKHIAAWLGMALLLMLVSGALGGLIGYNKGKADCQPVAADTITIVKVDTVTLVEPRDTLISYVWKLCPVAVHDTTTIVRHTTDSIFISLPYQYRHYFKPDTLDVWYSGIDPHIDSARVYIHHTTEIIRQPYEVKPPPNLVMVQAGITDASLTYMHRLGRSVWLGASAGSTYTGIPSARASVGFQF